MTVSFPSFWAKSSLKPEKNYKLTTIILSIISGFIYLFILKKFGYNLIDPALYTNRDDGVISFSHAVNWHDYGFIGVSPSGERVEGYSTPVHFFLYFIFYSLFHTGFDSYIKWQTIFGTFFLGYIFFNFFKEKPILGILFSVLSATLLSFATRFLEWHASGMENPISEVFLLLTVCLLYNSIKYNSIKYYYSLAFATASLTRIENIYYVFPILIVFLFIIWNTTLKRKALVTVFLTVLILVIIHGLRIMYFGSFQPNTSIGQNLDVTKQIFKTLTLDGEYYSYCSVIAFKLIAYNNGFLIVVALFLFYFIKRTPYNLFFVLSVFCVLLLTCFHAFIFKGERLDPIRYGAHLAPLAVTALLFPFANFNKLYNKHLIYVIPSTIIVCMFLKGATHIEAENICCSVKVFDYAKERFLKIKEENQIVRPMLANPDLGIISYTKDFNMMDMAYIGSPVLAKLSKSEILMNEYMFELNTPDILELHEYWACLHTHIFKDSRLNAKFNVFEEFQSQCSDSRAGIFVKKDILINSGSKERAFYDKIKKSLTTDQVDKNNFISILHSEIQTSSDSSIYSSVYIVSVLYKFIPELRKNDLLDKTIAECEKLPIHEYASAYLSSYSYGKWSDKVIKALLRFYFYDKFNKGLYSYSPEANNLPDNKFLKGEKDYKVYLNGSSLLYYGKSGRMNRGDRMYLHIEPENPEDIPVNERGAGFVNLDFDDINGIIIEGAHYIPVQLPPYKLKKIITGQFNSKGTVWETVIDIH